MTYKRFVQAALTAAALCLTHRAQATDAAPATKRIAVVVGSNDAAPGRKSLRFARDDAARIQDVLVRVGRFAPGDVQLLVEPKAADVLAAVDRAAQAVRAAGGDALFVFYYSGHSDGQSLFSHGEAVAVADVRDRIARTGARIRVGILDTCRGGSFTRTKGLEVGPPLDAADLMNVQTEGTALVSSSSGLENAHEADAVKGSFFTHHLTAGLLGAADRSGDGNVTLQEAFEYAKERTVRDSARLGTTAQHPSFELALRGRQDLVLTHVATSPSALDVTQSEALEIVHLGSGATVVETPPGSHHLRLALPPGRYIVRRVSSGKVYSKEIEVGSGATVPITDTQLELTGKELAMKGVPPSGPIHRTDRSTPAKRWWELRLGLGVSTARERSLFAFAPSQASEGNLQRNFAATMGFHYGITDRLSATLLGLSYRFGTHSSFEVLPYAGLREIGHSAAGGWLTATEAGVGTRAWTSRSFSLMTDLRGRYESGEWEDRARARAGLGAIWNLGDAATLHFGVAFDASRRYDHETVSYASPLPEQAWSAAVAARPRTFAQLEIGAAPSLGFRPLPLVQLHLSDRFSLDAYASWGIDFRTADVSERYLGGFTSSF